MNLLRMNLYSTIMSDSWDLTHISSIEKVLSFRKNKYHSFPDFLLWKGNRPLDIELLPIGNIWRIFCHVRMLKLDTGFSSPIELIIVPFRNLNIH